MSLHKNKGLEKKTLKPGPHGTPYFKGHWLFQILYPTCHLSTGCCRLLLSQPVALPFQSSLHGVNKSFEISFLSYRLLFYQRIVRLLSSPSLVLVIWVFVSESSRFPHSLLASHRKLSSSGIWVLVCGFWDWAEAKLMFCWSTHKFYSGKVRSFTLF